MASRGRAFRRAGPGTAERSGGPRPGAAMDPVP